MKTTTHYVADLCFDGPVGHATINYLDPRAVTAKLNGVEHAFARYDETRVLVFTWDTDIEAWWYSTVLTPAEAREATKDPFYATGKTGNVIATGAKAAEYEDDHGNRIWRDEHGNTWEA